MALIVLDLLQMTKDETMIEQKVKYGWSGFIEQQKKEAGSSVPVAVPNILELDAWPDLVGNWL